MYCPKCNKENPDNAQTCQFCSSSLVENSETKQPVTVKISRLSIIALALAVLSILVFFPPLVLLSGVLGRVVLLFPLLAVILGIISLVQIEKSGGKVTGRIFAVAAVLIPVFAGLSLVLIISILPVKSTAYRMVCGINLSDIGKAMIIYAGDYDEKFPRAGGRDSIWSNSIPDWMADNRYNAYGLSQDGSGGRATVSSSLYLLVKYMEVLPKSFLCKGDTGVTEFDPPKNGVRDKDLIDLWDFGPEPTKHCSYSYHMPYGPYALTTSCDPGLAVAADPNPWMMAPAAKSKNIAYFDPDGDREAIKAGNSITHHGDGQNILFMDAHVGFYKLSFCGINNDNIYTHWDGGDIRRGTTPKLGSQPADRLDSMLVNDPAISR